MDRKLIDQYASGADVPAKAVRGLTRADMLAVPIPGTWNIAQIILHLMDSDLIASDRMKRVIAEDRPTLIGYNETAFAQRLGYDDTDIETAVEIFRLNRLVTAKVLRRQSDETFRRIGCHNERGEVSLADFVATYAHHLDHHMGFLRKKRELLGKPL